MSGMARALSLFLFLLSTQVWAGPGDFGMAELRRAAAEKNVSLKSLRTAVTGGAPDSYVITPARITGGDERGLMYGLLEAAEQIRKHGRIMRAEGKPDNLIRGIRYYIHNEKMEEKWYYSKEYWDGYFSMFAKNRLNRFNLVFASQTAYLAPPYPFWVDVPGFPGISVPGLTPEKRKRNLDMLRYISQSAADHGVDFTLGIWQQNAWPSMKPSVVGIDSSNIGPYIYAALKKVLQECPAVKSVQMRTNSESGVPDGQQVAFYRDWIYKALRDAGRPVILDLRGWLMEPEMMNAATGSGLPMRLSAKYWAEHMSRPYQPVNTFQDFSYLDFLKKDRPYKFYWEMWTMGSHRIMLWGSHDYMKRVVPTFSMSNTLGFEIDAPIAQKGFGNRPEMYGIFADGQEQRVFWNWEYERYWMFYTLWGKMGYDHRLSKDIWLEELQKRFGKAAADVFTAYEEGSRVIAELVASNTTDPNMFVWPEIHPGRLIGGYQYSLPGDQSFIASPAEAAYNHLHQYATAKQGPRETAALLDGIAARIESAVDEASAELGKDHREWLGSKPDFQVLALMARFHARKMEAAYSLSWYYETGNSASLDRAEEEMVKGLAIWEQLVKLTDGLYPDEMTYSGPDRGHWKHKLQYVQHDVAWLRELKRIHQKYGHYDHRFDFGAPITEARLGVYYDNEYINGHTIHPRFSLIHPRSEYNEESGYGWYGRASGWFHSRRPHVHELEQASRNTVDLKTNEPKNLPRNMLFGDYINVPGSQPFRVRTGDGDFEVVVLMKDGSERRDTVQAVRGLVDFVFPDRGKLLDVSGLLMRNLADKKQAPPAEKYPVTGARPEFAHRPVTEAKPGTDIRLSYTVSPGSNVKTVRLHYRPLNTFVKVKVLEIQGSEGVFTIPGTEVSKDWDLLYHFEILNDQGSGWFFPDPAVRTPYFVISVKD